MTDEEWDRSKADRYAADIGRLESERLENTKRALRETKEFIRDFVASDKRILRQIRRLTGYLDENGIWPTHDPDDISTEDLIAPWEDAINAAEPVNDVRDLFQLIEEAEEEYEQERREQEEDYE
jgi:hypothetical protein